MEDPANPTNTAPPAPAVAPAAAQAPAAAPELEVALEFSGSSNIKGAKLTIATGAVVVEFANQTTYAFGGFTADLMAEWKESKSAGSWFHKNVKQHPERHPPLGPDGLPIAQASPAAAVSPAAPKFPTPKPAVAPVVVVEKHEPSTTKRAKQFWKDRPWRKPAAAPTAPAADPAAKP